MSSDDYIVDPLSDKDIRENARRTREYLGLGDAERIDPLVLEQAKQIWTVKGVKPFRLEVVSDEKLRGDSGLTYWDGDCIVAQIPRHIRHKAYMGDGYARFTIAHELGHVTQHLDKLLQGASMPRRAIGNKTWNWIPKFKSAEHHANVYGGAFLINDKFARALTSPEEISIQAGVSLHAARIYFERIQEELSRPSSNARVKRIAEEAVEALAPREAKSNISFLKECCTYCGQTKLFPVGHKFMCAACDAVYDRFQDGDPVE